MRLLFLNPNSTDAMTESVVATAARIAPGDEIVAWTNRAGPSNIEGPEDNAAAIPGLLSMVPRIEEFGPDAVVIACFDDTGLDQVRLRLACPVLGIGQASYSLANLLGSKFAVLLWGRLTVVQRKSASGMGK